VPHCPACNTPLTGGETFCLQCGTRLVPEPEPRRSYATPAAIIAVIALIAVGAVVFALNQVESDAEREATKPAIVVKPPDQSGSEDKPTDVAAWPAGTSAYTVVLAQTPDEATARARATAAVGGGVPAGVLDSDAYPTLQPGMWVLFTGEFDTQAEAAEEAARFVASGFPEAAAAFVSDRRELDG
jgi:predicted nucleic acid-binding Zn ribbon protein